MRSKETSLKGLVLSIIFSESEVIAEEIRSCFVSGVEFDDNAIPEIGSCWVVDRFDEDIILFNDDLVEEDGTVNFVS